MYCVCKKEKVCKFSIYKTIFKQTILVRQMHRQNFPKWAMGPKLSKKSRSLLQKVSRKLYLTTLDVIANNFDLKMNFRPGQHFLKDYL